MKYAAPNFSSVAASGSLSRDIFNLISFLEAPRPAHRSRILAPHSGLQVRQTSRTAANQLKPRGRNLLIGLRESFEIGPKWRISLGWIAPKVDELSDGS